MLALPTVRSGAVALYPVTRGVNYKTGVAQFCDDTEQRWVSNLQTADFTLEYDNLNGYDLSALVQFFRSAQGKFNETVTFTINGNTYNNLMLMADTLAWAESKQPELYTLKVSLKQWRPN